MSSIKPISPSIPSTRYYSTISSSHRLSVIKSDELPFARLLVSVITIQKYIRSYIVRKKYNKLGYIKEKRIKYHNVLPYLTPSNGNQILYNKFIAYVQHLRSLGVAGVEKIVLPYCIPTHYAPDPEDLKSPNSSSPTAIASSSNIISPRINSPIRTSTQSRSSLTANIDPTLLEIKKDNNILEPITLSIKNLHRVIEFNPRFDEPLPMHQLEIKKKEKHHTIKSPVYIPPPEPKLHNSKYRMLDYENYAAIKIQSWIRKIQYMKRYRFKKHFIYHIAAYVIQQCYKNYKIRIAKPEYNDPIAKYAIIIQRAWRSFMDKKIYQYYKNLIRLREQGDPSLLLKVLHPSESFLADPAAKLYVRLRLGGATFPPLVYYKVFTKMNITDIGSFAPRDYVTKKPEKGYMRWENNGWRPMSFIEPKNRELDAPKEWHADKIVRKQINDKKKKEAKRKWMQHLYAMGAAKEKINDHYSVENQGEEEELELLNWSASLDFDSYHDNWSFLATTGLSDRAKDIVNDYELPSELKLRTAGNTRESGMATADRIYTANTDIFGWENEHLLK